MKEEDKPSMEMQRLWEACRDGEADAESRARLEQWLADHPTAKAWFDAETQWLQSLGESLIETGGPRAVRNEARFTDAVLGQWAGPEHRGVLARIRWRSAVYSAGWAAAAAAIAIAMWVYQPTKPAGSDFDDDFVVRARPGWPLPMINSNEHPLTAMMREVGNNLPRPGREGLDPPMLWNDPTPLWPQAGSPRGPVINLDHLADRVGLRVVTTASAPGK